MLLFKKMGQLITSDFKLGIIAGGQLGKMLALTSANWDVKTFVLDADVYGPASTFCTKFVRGNPLNFGDVLRFGRMTDMISVIFQKNSTS